jgi:hypothetical protein
MPAPISISTIVPASCFPDDDSNTTVTQRDSVSDSGKIALLLTESPYLGIQVGCPVNNPSTKPIS